MQLSDLFVTEKKKGRRRTVQLRFFDLVGGLAAGQF